MILNGRVLLSPSVLLDHILVDIYYNDAIIYV